MKFHPEILLSALVVAACSPTIDTDELQKKLELLPTAGITASAAVPESAFEWENDSAFADRVNQVFPLIDEFWQLEFNLAGIPYKSPKLIIWLSTDNYSPEIDAFADPKTGPVFIRKRDELFLPVPRLWELDEQPGENLQLYTDFALAHEYSHHVIQQLGVNQAISKTDIFIDPIRRNFIIEFTAGCLAGISLRTVYQQTDITIDDVVALYTQSRIRGISEDDLIESNKKLFGNPHPDAEWFMEGFRNGIPALCNALNNYPLPPK